MWNGRVLASRRLRKGADCAGIWQERQSAERYDTDVKKDGRAQALATLGMMNLPKAGTVLDIGAGPGTYAIPMAKMGLAVTAVEPSPGMADVLAANVEAERIGRLDIIRKRWEDVRPEDLAGSYDIVLASLSLGMPDIRIALEKMNHACQGKVYLIWPAGKTAWERNYIEAWPLIHGEPYVSGPKADVLFNVLCQIGICPDVRVFRENYEETFSSLAEAIGYYRHMYCAAGPDQESVLAGFLAKKLCPCTGGLTMKGISTMALLGWDVHENCIED